MRPLTPEKRHCVISGHHNHARDAIARSNDQCCCMSELPYTVFCQTYKIYSVLEWKNTAPYCKIPSLFFLFPSHCAPLAQCAEALAL